ncbi:sacsin N-terminal ATP-binding-like domain-containing protein [Actinomycetes bacterium M1A6_2h]
MLASWDSSPTRLREDAATETDLVRGGYRDRVLTELVQNAADAAGRAGVPGRVAVWVDGRALHVANVGAPLTRSGLTALAALRASDKSEGAIGRYGVGFTATRSLGDRIEFRSRTGSVVFDADWTRRELAAVAVAEPADGIPVLRLPWPTDELPAEGWDSEVVVTARDDVDLTQLLADFEAEVIDLLLEVEGVESITLSGNDITRTTNADRVPEEVHIGDLVWWQGRTERARWLMPVIDAQPRPIRQDVLRAPTRSDETLSLPAVLVTDVPLQPDRRRILPGSSLRHVAAGYAGVVRTFPPPLRLSMVPRPGLATGAVDAEIRELVGLDLMSNPWIPTVVGDDVRPGEAAVLPGASAELSEILAEVVPGLVIADFADPSDTSLLASVGVHVLGLSRVVEMLSGVARDPGWWRSLYEALAPLVRDGAHAEEVAALPVPLTDGRTVTGPRTAVVLREVGDEPIGRVSWARVIHPAAVHPVLTLLGAQDARAADVLSDPALGALLEDDYVTDELVDEVLTLAQRLDGSMALASTLGRLPLEDSDGDVRAADELLLPTSPLAAVLAPDSPFGSIAPSLVDRYGAAVLRSVGVGWSFAVVRDDDPTGPDHDLDDEEAWWDTLPDEPDSLLAVRDLDLVDDDAWPAALTVLLNDPQTADACSDRLGYTAWWLRRHARIDRQRLGAWRLPGHIVFDGLLDPLDHPDSDRMASLVAPQTIDDADLAQLLLDRLADERRRVAPAVVVATHSAVAAAVESNRLDVAEIEPPSGVRCVSGVVCGPDDALVLDRTWLAAVLDPAVTVLGRVDTAEALADVLDCRTASSALSAVVTSVGVDTVVAEDPVLTVWRVVSGISLESEIVCVHDDLTVSVDGGPSRSVPFWVEDTGRVHVSRKWEW